MGRRSAHVFFTQMQQPAPRGMEAGCLVLFSLPFLLAGLFVMGLGLSSFVAYFRSAHWDPVPATVQSVDLKESRGSKGGRSYSVECSYTYEYEGRVFRGTRVGLEQYKSSDGSHVRRYNELRDAQLNHQTVTALVNPLEPTEALLYREVTPTALMTIPFGFVFAAVGGGMGFGSLWSWRKSRILRRRRSADPDRPWTHEEKWPSFESRSASWQGIALLWAVAATALSFTGSMLAMVMSSSNRPLIAVVVVGAFFTGALALFGWTFYVTAAYLKYGRSRLLFPQMPLVPGGIYDCSLIVNRMLVGDAPIFVTVRCVEAFTTGSGKQRKTVKKNVFESTTELDRRMIDAFDRRIPLVVEVPTGFPQRVFEGNPTYSWELEVKAEEPGVDFKAVFELPVFEVADRSLVQPRSTLVMG
jgi:hypothetical protein